MADCSDPRHLCGTTVAHPNLRRIIKGWQNEDPAPARVGPIPLDVLHNACSIARTHNTTVSHCAADLIWLGFYFLLRRGEYTLAGPKPRPFKLEDVRLWHNQTPIDPLTATTQVLLSATFVVLIFQDQKNAVRGEPVGHGRSGLPFACPVLSTVRRVIHLRSLNAPPTTPLGAIHATHDCISPDTRHHLDNSLTRWLRIRETPRHSSPTNPPKSFARYGRVGAFGTRG